MLALRSSLLNNDTCMSRTLTRSRLIGLAGAGLLGRLLAWRLGALGHRVEVFDPATGPGPRFHADGPTPAGHAQCAGFSAAGMLSPLAELDNAGHAATLRTLTEGRIVTIQADETLCLVGESGCGKTSTAQAVMRLVDAESGAIRFEGRDLSGVGHRALPPDTRRDARRHRRPDHRRGA